LSERDAVDHAGLDLSVGGQDLQLDAGSGRHGTGRACGTAADIGENDVAGLGKRIARVQASEGDRNVAGNTSASPPHVFLWSRAQVQDSHSDLRRMVAVWEQ
jgi:hypothetical protein